MKTILFALLLVTTQIFAGPVIPPPIPINPAVTPQTLDKTICSKNEEGKSAHWTASVRPPDAVTMKQKLAAMAKLGIPASDAGLYEWDHFLPIELGGMPNDPRNFRLQAYADKEPHGLDTQARKKDVIETRLAHLICAGKIPLREAQVCIWNDWRACAKAHP